jgi:phage-related protein (TIGR01555 family)
MLKPAYAMGGQSMTEIALPYVNNWLKVRQGVTDIITAYSVFVLSTNMQDQLNAGGGSGTGAGSGDALFNRADAFNMLRDNRGLMIIDKDLEQFQNVAASLAGLEGLQAQAQEHLAAVWKTPIIKLLGIEPTGLNASSEGSLQSFEANINAYQERFFRPNLTRVIDFAMLNLWGAIDPDITFIFEPLEPMNEKELAEIQQIEARTAQLNIENGAIDPGEERARIANDPFTCYPGLDVDKIPDLKTEEAEGLVIKGGGKGAETP